MTQEKKKERDAYWQYTFSIGLNVTEEGKEKKVECTVTEEERGEASGGGSPLGGIFGGSWSSGPEYSGTWSPTGGTWKAGPYSGSWGVPPRN